MSQIDRIGVVGGGAWGTALAQTVAGNGLPVLLWAREPDVVEAVNRDHANPPFLPDLRLDPTVRATGDLAELAGSADVLLLAAPAQHLRAVVTALAPHLPAETPLVVCAKGIERDSCALLSEVLAEVAPGSPLAVLSGPTFAAEVARGLPTAVTLACADADLGGRLTAALGRPTFRPYLADDLIGAQIGGAVKNVIAIACGIVEGRGLGDNARAALMTRGFAEMVRYGMARGARPATLHGLSGLGDLTLTCNSDQSRNMTLGIRIGAGELVPQIVADRRTVAEGMFTVSAVVDDAKRLGVDMPICLAVEGVVNYDAGVDATIDNLLARPFTRETG